MIIEHIISQHAEESAFLWLLRDDAVNAPHYSLKDLGTLEGRIEAHLDGLRVAGDPAWSYCQDGLKQEEAGEVFAAAYLALDNGREDWLLQVLEAVQAAPEAARGFISALGWLPKERLQGHVVKWLKSDDDLLRQLGHSACNIQRVDCGAFLQQAVDDQVPAIRARALRCVGELPRPGLIPSVLEHLKDEDETCRFRAAWSATLLGQSEGIGTLLSLGERSEAFSDEALMLALRAMKKQSAMQWVSKLNGTAGFEYLVIRAAGVVGDPVSVPWLISKMESPELARVAGEAISLITGVDLAYDDLEGDWPEGFEAGPTDNPADEDVSMDPDEDLPWPDAALISQWWSEAHSRFPAGTRLLCGRPVSRESCLKVLRHGFQRQRRAAALELALIQQKGPLFNTAATAKRQTLMLDEF